MLRKLLGAALVLIVLDGFAYPTKVELRKASPLVTDLMARDVADFKAEKKTAEEVGDAAAGYVQKASGEAAKLLLLKGAFHYYVLGKSYDKATRTLKDMQREVAEMDLAWMTELIEREARSVKPEDAPQLFAHYRLLRVQATAKDELRKTRLALRSSPKDKDLIRKLGEAQAITGDWEAALETFAKLKAGVGPHARAEKLGRNLLETADFWWNYASYAGKDATPIFRRHAARLYRLVLTRDEAESLRKDVVKARLKLVHDGGISSWGSAGLYLVVDLSSGPESDKYPISWLKEMPAGGWTDEYKTMKLVLRRIGGEQDKTTTESSTDFSEQYFIGVFEVTQKQYELVTGENPACFKGDTSPVEKVSYSDVRGNDLGAKYPDSIEVDADSFMGKFRRRTGLQFDLPTEKQWEFACRAGTTTKYSYGDEPNGDYMWCRDNSGGRTHTVGKKLPNPWGLYDIHGNVWEWCLRNKSSRGILRGGTHTDPVDSATSSFQFPYANPEFRGFNIGFRLVVILQD